MKRILFAAFAFWAFAQCADAQAAPSAGPAYYTNQDEAHARPPSLRLPVGEAGAIVRIQLAPVRADERKALDDANRAAGNKRLQIGFRRVLADSAGPTLADSPLNWTPLSDGGHAAHFSTTSPQAAALRLGLAIVRMDSGVELRFFGSADPGHVYGPVTRRDVPWGEALYWTPVVDGETLTTEIYLPPGLTPDSFVFDVPEVSHLVATVATADVVLKAIGDSGSCERDVACISNPSQALLDAANAVVRMSFVDAGSSYLCTGTLLNDKVAGTFIPYLYGAAHCISTQSSAGTLNTYWFFQASVCGGSTAPNAVQKTGGATLLHTDAALDDVLLRLNDAPPSGAVFAGWDAAVVPTGTSVTAIHHPAGDLKKVSLGSASGYGAFNGQGSFILASWSSGATEGGSSGSGLFTFNGASYDLRGGLKGGGSSCTTAGGTDKYSRLDQVYPYIQQYLDPASVTCSPTISPSSQSAAAGGLTGSVSVTVAGTCTWTAVSNASWITITSGSSGTGNGTVAYVVAVNGGAGARSGTMTIAGSTYTVTQAGTAGPAAANLLANPGFESGATGWTQVSAFPIITNGAQVAARTGSWYAWLGGAVSATDALYQDVAIPADAPAAYVQFWYRIGTNETSTLTAWDTMDVDVYSTTTNTRLAGLVRLSNLNKTSAWVQSATYDVSAFRGQTIRLRFSSINDLSSVTNFFVDDVSLTTDAGAGATLTVSRNGAGSGTVTGTGIDCGSDCTETYAVGTGVTLTATPAAGSTFSGWSGACTNVSGTCALTMSAARSVTATFSTAVVPPTGQAGFTPWQGAWLNWNESGSGYNITVQGGTIMVLIFSYKTTGDSEWYLASGSLTNGGTTFTGTLDKYRNGQCISCGYANAPVQSGNDGTMTIVFSDETHAVLTLPNGRTTSIVPFNFGQGVAPDALLGEWIYTYDIVSTWADRYTFTTIVAGTANSDGLAVDLVHDAACELEVRGTPSLVGMVLCVQLDASGARQNAYSYRYGIDQTYGGLWVSPSDNAYPMKGFLTKWRNGQSKSASPAAAGLQASRDSTKAAEDLTLSGSGMKASTAEFNARLDELAARMRAARAAR